jgi:hypothetical protein
MTSDRLYGNPGDGRTVYVKGTNIAWHGLGGYVAAVAAEVCPWIASSARYERNRQLYESVQSDDILSCYDPRALADAERLFDHGRWKRSPSGIGSAIGRERLGALLVEVRNQSTRLSQGRYRKGVKGARFDPRLIPTDRLLSLIQSHADMRIVERLRDELERRTGCETPSH